MSTASGSQHSVSYVAETQYGVTPESPAFVGIRNKGCTLNLTKDALRSEEITGSRQITGQVTGAKKIGGDIPFELSYGSLDPLLEAVLCATGWVRKATITATTISAAGGDNSFSDSANGFVAAGFVVGEDVQVLGFVGEGLTVNNLAKGRLTSVAAGKIIIAGTDGDVIVDAVAGASVTIRSLTYRIKAGTTRHSFTMERHFEDLDTIMRFTGCELDKMSLQVGANAIVTGAFSVMGQDMTLTDDELTGSTYEVVAMTAPTVSFRGVLKEGGVENAAVTELSLNLENNLGACFVIGSQVTQQPSLGVCNVSGQMTVYFTSKSLLEKFLADTESSLEVSFLDVAGNKITIVLPRVVFTAAPADVKGDGPITLAMPFQALYHTASGTNIIIERLAA